MTATRLIVREDRVWERIVFAEVLVPNTINNYGDWLDAEGVAAFAHEFSRQGYGVDVDHDEQDIAGVGAYVVESFLAREGDPDFIAGSWVIGMKIEDDALWQRVLDGEINGFSYQALVEMNPVEVPMQEPRQVVGLTAPHPEDEHTHSYVLFLDELNNPQTGGTSVTNGHSHTIVSHTVTEEAEGHVHRFQVITG